MRKLLFVLSVMALPLASNAQYNWEYGGGLGVANYLGDMGGNELTRRDFVADMKLKQTRASSNIFARYKLSPMFSIKSSLNFIILRGADSLSTNVPRNTRNLNFRNRVFELSNECQFFFYEVNDLGHTYRYRNGFRAYIGAGVGVMYHSPQAFYQGDWVALRPLMTEGNNYTKLTLSLPVSGGFYFTVAKIHRIGWNLCWRTTFTDYLDDVSTTYADPNILPSPMAIALANRTYERPNVDPVIGASFAPGEKRGDPTHNDSFLTTNIEYSYVIRGKSSIYKSKYSSLFKGKKYKRRKVRAKF